MSCRDAKGRARARDGVRSCTAILGDFEVSGTSGNTSEAGDDGTSGDGIRLAIAEVDFNAANFGSVRAGLVSQADLTAGFDGTKVPAGFTISSFSDVPSESEARFFGADTLWLGTPPEPLRVRA